MTHTWMLDVLSDLEGTARKEGFDAFADTLRAVRRRGEHDLANRGNEGPTRQDGHGFCRGAWGSPQS